MGYSNSCKLFAIIIAFFLFPTLVSAFSCNQVEDYESCIFIQESNLTLEEKEMLIASLIYQSKVPDHNFIFNWNNNLNIDLDGINSQYIKDAWLKIITVSHSVLEDNELYCNGNGKILLDYDYNVEIPS